MSASLVGSEMCIRDSCRSSPQLSMALCGSRRSSAEHSRAFPSASRSCRCLLYTSDAADDM
eukprot:8399167-Alexandrium_andersonii.AAC.1